jgi:hypothetical protein
VFSLVRGKERFQVRLNINDAAGTSFGFPRCNHNLVIVNIFPFQPFDLSPAYPGESRDSVQWAGFIIGEGK